MRYLALGDSYTIGEGVAESERWPVQLAQRLRARGRDYGDPEIIAKTGWTTDELDAAIMQRNPRGPYDLVSLLIGVNNQYRGRPVDEYRAQLRTLVDRAKDFAAGIASHVVMVSIPDWGLTPFNTSRPKDQVSRDIDAFNAVGHDEARAASVHWVDITDLSRADPKAVVADGLHPNGAMYRQWAQRIDERLKTKD